MDGGRNTCAYIYKIYIHVRIYTKSTYICVHLSIYIRIRKHAFAYTFLYRRIEENIRIFCDRISEFSSSEGRRH